MDQTMEKVSVLSDDRALPSRIRFMMKDTLDLRRAGWKQRIEKEQAKKLKDIEKEAAKESNSSSRDNNSSRDKDRRDNRGGRNVPPVPTFTMGAGRKDRYASQAKAATPKKTDAEAVDEWQTQDNRKGKWKERVPTKGDTNRKNERT